MSWLITIDDDHQVVPHLKHPKPLHLAKVLHGSGNRICLMSRIKINFLATIAVEDERMRVVLKNIQQLPHNFLLMKS